MTYFWQFEKDVFATSSIITYWGLQNYVKIKWITFHMIYIEFKRNFCVRTG